MSATDLDLYAEVADASAGLVIRRYSTSFGLASGLLGPGVRGHVANVYGLVRLADEIVDGPAEQAGLPRASRRAALDHLEEQARDALETGYSTNLIVHAFAGTARRHGIGTDLLTPFFASMRTDLDRTEFTPEQAAEYVYGSAEVIGLMCLRIFEAGRERTPEERETLERGARALGSAFQRVNFLRDYATDVEQLGRHYLPEARDGLTPEARDAVVASIREELALADAAIPLLDVSARSGVRAARELFGRLNELLAEAGTGRIRAERVRVPDREKLAILLRAAASSAAGRTDAALRDRIPGLRRDGGRR